MQTRQQIIAKNKRNRAFREGMSKILKVAKTILITILVIIVVGLLAAYVVESIETHDEMAALNEAKLHNLIDVDGTKINVAVKGNKNGNHTFVTISDVGVQNFSVYADRMLKFAQTDNCVALVDRAGYGLSDDSSEPQTVEQIVETYRSALKAAKLNGPYILFAHNFGGVYATYWSSTYPDEVESIIYIEGAILDEEYTSDVKPSTFTDTLLSYAYKIGFQRLYYNTYYTYSPPSITKEEAECARALNMQSFLTRAYLSERDLMEENMKKVAESLEASEIPKLYISALNGFRNDKDVLKYWEYKNTEAKELNKTIFYNFGRSESQINKDVSKFIDQSSKKYYSETVKFCESLGNCVITRIPGDIKIHEQKPDGVAEALADYVLYLDGEIENMKSDYDDSKVVEWEKYQEGQASDKK